MSQLLDKRLKNPISITVFNDDVDTLRNIIRMGYDESGIIAHILDELGVNMDNEVEDDDR